MATNTLSILKPSVNNLTARIFVRAAGLDFEELDVWGKKSTPEFLAKDPADLTPLLEEEGLPKGALWESCAIMQYLCNKHGLDRFYPTDPGERAMVDSAMFYLIGTFYPLLARATYPALGFPQYPGEVATSDADDDMKAKAQKDAEAALAAPLEAFRTFFLAGRPFVGGASPSIADMRWAATLEFLRAIDYPFPAWTEEYMRRMEDSPRRRVLRAGGRRARLHRLRAGAERLAEPRPAHVAGGRHGGADASHRGRRRPGAPEDHEGEGHVVLQCDELRSGRRWPAGRQQRDGARVRELGDGEAAGHARFDGLDPRAGGGETGEQEIGVRRARRAPRQESLAVEVGEAGRARAGEPVVGRDAELDRRRTEGRALDPGPAAGRAGEDQLDAAGAEQWADLARSDLAQRDGELGGAIAQRTHGVVAIQRPDGRRDAHANRAREPMACFAGVLEGSLRRRECLPPVLEERRAGGGEPHLVRRPLEQFDAELRLELAHRLRDRLLGKGEAARGAREVQLLGDRDEDAELPELRHARRLQLRGVK